MSSNKDAVTALYGIVTSHPDYIALRSPTIRLYNTMPPPDAQLPYAVFSVSSTGLDNDGITEGVTAAFSIYDYATSYGFCFDAFDVIVCILDGRFHDIGTKKRVLPIYYNGDMRIVATDNYSVKRIDFSFSCRVIRGKHFSA